MSRAVPGLAAVVSILLAACLPGGLGAPDGSGLPGGDGAIEHPRGADEPIVVVEHAGGFVPVEFAVTQMPAFVLLGDGRAIVQGAQTLIYPGPALPPLLVRTLTEEGIQEVLALIAETDLFDGDLELRGAQNMVADAADTIFTVNAGGSEVTVTVYGLGTVTPLPGAEPAPDLPISEAELRAHVALQEIQERLLMLDAWLPADAFADDGWQPYEPDAFRLYVRDVTDEPLQDESGIAPGIREWPTEASGDPAEFGEPQENVMAGTRCGVVAGDEGQVWLEELRSANQLTQWSDDGERRFSVVARPLLPHEERACLLVAGA